MFPTSTIELSQSALQNNLRFIKTKINEGVRLCSVVKGNAYGHGIAAFVSMAVKEGVDCFAVHSAEEAFELHGVLPKNCAVFIMGAVDGEAVTWAVNHEVEISVFDFSRLQAATTAALNSGRKALVHIELETGMNRTGFKKEEIPVLIQWLLKHKENITFQGLYTHFGGAESVSNHYRIEEQKQIFEEVYSLLQENDLNPVYHHMACSAALLNYPETQGNMVRIGILQYGFWPNMETYIRYSKMHNLPGDILRRVIKWKSNIYAVQQVSKGQFIGYGTAYLAHKDMVVALAPVGYAHGYARNLSNVGQVLVQGKVCTVIGIINMNSISIDVTACHDVKKGDEVILIGKQKSKAITVNSFSEQSQLLNYELLTRLPSGIPRKITK